MTPKMGWMAWGDCVVRLEDEHGNELAHLPLSALRVRLGFSCRERCCLGDPRCECDRIVGAAFGAQGEARA